MPVALDAFGMNLAWAGVGTAVCYKPLLLLALLLVLGAVLCLLLRIACCGGCYLELAVPIRRSVSSIPQPASVSLYAVRLIIC